MQGAKYQQIVRYRGYDAARRYARMVCEALDWMREQVETLAIDCRRKTKAAVTYATSPEGAGVVEREAEAAAAARLEVRLIDELPLPFPIRAAVCLPS